MSELIQIHPLNPQDRNIKKVTDCLKKVGLLFIQQIPFMVLVGCHLGVM